MRGLRGKAERRLRRRRIEQIAFEIQHPRVGHEVGRHVRLAEAHAGAEIGVHGPLPVRRHQDQAARGRRAVPQVLGREQHAGFGHVAREHRAQ